MKTVGIICEYNPPHNGHAYQIAEIRRRYPDAAIVCVMSGCFVQRGTPAVLSPGTRARAAAAMGADVVLELPPAYALAPAELFARGGMAILSAIGTDTLCFGAECCGDGASPTAALTEAAAHLDCDTFRTALKDAQNDPGNAALGMPVLRESVYRALYGDASILTTPNNVLGIEYIRAIRHLRADITPVAIPRRGADHDAPMDAAENGSAEKIASATAIRDCLYNGEDALALAYLPPASAALLSSAKEAGRMARRYEPLLGALLLAHYRSTDTQTLSRYAGLSGGRGARMKKAAMQSATLTDFYAAAAAKNLTGAAIRRSALCGYFGITQEEQQSAPRYVNLLARSEGDRAAAVLRRADRTGLLPIVTRPASYKALPNDSKAVAARDLWIASVWGMLCERPISAADWLRERV